jgi:hypothetical protein
MFRAPTKQKYLRCEVEDQNAKGGDLSSFRSRGSRARSLCRGALTAAGGAAVRRNPPLRGGDSEEVPFAGHALELMSAAVFEFES